MARRRTSLFRNGVRGKRFRKGMGKSQATTPQSDERALRLESVDEIQARGRRALRVEQQTPQQHSR